MRVDYRGTYDAYKIYFRTLPYKIGRKTWILLPLILLFVFVMYLLVELLAALKSVKRFWTGYRAVEEVMNYLGEGD